MFAFVVAVPAVLYLRTRINRIFLFWFAYVFTRPVPRPAFIVGKFLGVIAPVFVLPVRAFDVEFSGSKPTPAAATEAVKSATHGAARPEHLSA